MSNTVDRRVPPPSAQARAWAAEIVGGRGARVVRARALVGGTTSAVHALTIESTRGSRTVVVLRRWLRQDDDDRLDRVRREAEVLRALGSTEIPGPELLGADDTGDRAGTPSLLMAKLPGAAVLAPRDREGWLREMAEMLARIHDAHISASPFFPWLNELRVPDWAQRRDVWLRAIEVAQQPDAPFKPAFVHRDYQHFNLLWTRGRITGVVDWVYAYTGPADVDVGHCRLNLALLFDVDTAERFLRLYEAASGRAADPWWDLHALMEYLPGWDQLAIQIAGRAPFDERARHRRVEQLVETTLRRLP